MALAMWTEQYRVGVPVIDGQHQGLFRLTHDLLDATAKGHGTDILDSILNDLIQETRAHFLDEEAMLVRCRYPGYASHRAEHQALIRQVLELQRALRAGETAVTIQVVQFLANWLDQHIRKSDLLYAPHVAKSASHAETTDAIPVSR